MDPKKVTNQVYDQMVYAKAKEFADSLGMQDFRINSLDRLSQMVTDAAGDRVAFELIYQANVRLQEENKRLKRDVGRLYDELTQLKLKLVM